MGRKPTTYGQHYCGRCTASFSSRDELSQHLQNHADAPQAEHICPVCKWPFPDSLALERHAFSAGHSQTAAPSPVLKCDRCSHTFTTQREYNSHRKHGQPCCDANHSQDWKNSRPRPAFDDLDKPKLVSREVPTLEYSDDTSKEPSDVSGSEIFCHNCKVKFPSEASYNRHILGCTVFINNKRVISPPVTPLTPDENGVVATSSSVNSRHTLAVQVPQTRVQEPTITPDNLHPPPLQVVSLNTRPPVPAKSPTPPVLQTPYGPNRGPKLFLCNMQRDCQKSFKSGHALKQHQDMVHGAKGQALLFRGENEEILVQHNHERHKAEGLLEELPRARRSKRDRGRGGLAAPAPMHNIAAFPIGVSQRTPMAHRPYQPMPHIANANGPPPVPTHQSAGGPLDMEQANLIRGKTLPLLLQTDVFIHHDGKMSVGGVIWTRIGVDRQRDVVGMFDKMCHLPRILQSEYVPAPKTFLSDYKAQYPVLDFQSAPARNPATVRLEIVALACSKIELIDKRQEAVKIAAVDVLTCRILMSYIVCPDLNAKVANWHSPVTGFANFRDMEHARQVGYKVLKGWDAARAALFSFIDRETIIVGHNLRADLDALRIIHGRAVDIAKVVEKAAQGPLSRVQVSLDSWCRDVANVASLTTDPTYGRDCLMNAFAARELGLWIIKNRAEFEKKAKQKSREYQSVS